MLGPGTALTVAFYVITSMMGLMGNIFIVTVHVTCWIRSQGLTTCEIILFSLGTSNICFQLSLSIGNIFNIIHKSFFSTYITLRFLPVIIGTSFYSSLWFATWLCVFYNVKINSCQLFFIRLKIIFPKMVPWLLLGSLLLSLGISIAGIWDTDLHSSSIATANISDNSTSFSMSLISRCSCFFYILILVNVLAFVIFLSSAVLILTSLYRHIRQMKRNMGCLRYPQLDAHLRAARTVIFLLLFHMMYFLNETFIISGAMQYGSNWFWIYIFFMSLFPTLNSFLLILGNSRLKKALDGIFLLIKF
ncbi:taste receptor type 2 member 41-like [Rhinatrema bivittatum]|uniref:taste receptor type 2 member 41-like n=1 Tax=Rhinatrema bivittatum TaxID=194408 RepID=UPI00112BFFEF|nr:taste receptor type 2 member 41-like [Rhinatrema bivittatum]